MRYDLSDILLFSLPLLHWKN